MLTRFAPTRAAATGVCPKCNGWPDCEVGCSYGAFEPYGPEDFRGSDDESHYMSQTRITTKKD